MATETKEGLSVKEVAGICGTDARTLRKFLREYLLKEEQPGQGGRYSFTKGEANTLRKAFDKWAKEGVAKKQAAAEPETTKAKGKKGKAAPEAAAPEVVDDLEEIVDL